MQAVSFGKALSSEFENLRITLFGTRGSLPVSGPAFTQFGGNTTCLQVESDLLPEGTVLALDAGTGFLPLTNRALSAGMKHLVLLHTHYHHDHTQAFLIAAPVYMQSLPVTIAGPSSDGFGARECYERLMCPPCHPVSYSDFSAHLRLLDITDAEGSCLLISRAGEVELASKTAISSARQTGKVEINQAHFDLSNCLIVTMHVTKHPQTTFSYRIQEGIAGKAFVFLTDEEVRDEIPLSLLRHLEGADLLIQDAQYTEEVYRTRTKGFGHGTPAYAVRLASGSGIRRVGLTHHDPKSSDMDIMALLAEGQMAAQAANLEIFACKDYDTLII